MTARAEAVPGPLVVVCGLPGSGKSALARALSTRLRACYLSSDGVRRELALLGSYDDASNARVYRELLARAGLALRGCPVVLDATFADRRLRDGAVQVATQAGAAWYLLLMRADEATALRRVGVQRPDSEAGPEALALLSAAFDPVTLPHLVLDSTVTPTGELAERAERFVRTRAPITAA